MIGCSYKVTDLFAKSSKYADYEFSLSKTLSKFLKLTLKEIPIPNKSKTIKDFISKRSLSRSPGQFNKLRISEIVNNESSCIIAYPESDITEIYSIMTNLGLNIVPVVKTPWNKKLMGFVNKNQLEKEIKKISIA